MFKKFIFICTIVLFAIVSPIAAQNNTTTCGDCDGKISGLSLQYDGDKSALVEVIGAKGEQVFSKTVAPNEILTLTGFDKKKTLGTNISLYIDGKLNTDIHTSCSEPLLIGMRFGLFVVTDGFSRNGGQICVDDKETEVPEVESCGACDGKMTSLALQYNGTATSLIEVYAKKDLLIFSKHVSPHEIFTLHGFDKKNTLNTVVKLHINGVYNTEIHTSCSVELLIGMDFGVFTIKDGFSRNGGQICAQPEYAPMGTVCGVVFKDDNKNGIKDVDESSVAGISVDVTDVTGKTSSVFTEVTGKYCAYDIVEGTVSVAVDITTLPEGTTLVSGENPSTLYVLDSVVNDAGLDGYLFLKPDALEQNITIEEDTEALITLEGEDQGGQILTYTILDEPSEGTLSGTVPNLTYTPNPNYTGSDSFTFKVNNGLSDSDVARVNITITPVNDAPVALDDNVSTNEDTNITIDVLVNDSDVDGTLDITTLSVITSPTHGTATIIDGNISYLPHANYHGVDSFTYTIKDNEGLVSNQATVNIIINEINDAPLAHEQSFILAEDTTIDVILTGSDNDGDILVYNVVTQPNHGTLSGTAPYLTYTPHVNYHGPDSFTFHVNDGNLTSNEATIHITVTPINDAPLANDDNASTNEDTGVVIEVLANDSDIDGTLDDNSLVIESNASQGSISIENGKVVYTPNSNYFGADSCTYSIKDNEGLISNTATVFIVVNSINDIPLAQDQSLTTPEDTSIDIELVGTDTDGDTLTYTVTTQPTNGTLSGTAPNLTYIPNKDYQGYDSFKFIVNDGTANSLEATVNIMVVPVNDAPVAKDLRFIIPEDTNISILLEGEDSDGDILTYNISTSPVNGTVTGEKPRITYSPNVGYYGVETFNYTVNDGTLDSDEATVTIEIIRQNVAAPIALDQNLITDEDTPLDIKLEGLDSDGDTLDYIVMTEPSYGTLSGTGQNMTYTPNENYSGSDSFIFKVNDGLLDSNEATVNIVVTPKAEETCEDNTTSIGQFNPVIKFEWDWANATYPSYNQVMSSPMVGQLTDDNEDGEINDLDTPDIVFTSFRGSNYTSDGVLRIISGDDGHEILSIRNVNPYNSPALGDIDNDGKLEVIVGINRNGGLKVFENDGTLKWAISTSFSGEIAIADLDNDGVAEILYGNGVYDANGIKLWSFNHRSIYDAHIAVNLDEHNDLEVIANGRAYDNQGNLLWYVGANCDGSAVGNFDDDKYPEIAMVCNESVLLVEHDGTIIWGPVALEGGGEGPLTVADVDGDGEPEIGIAGGNYYFVFETDGSIKWKSETRDNSSWRTGSTVFDFEGDGKAEILYNDELYFRIYDGTTGDVLFDINNSSHTLFEYPVIADIDNDNHAEIILITNNHRFYSEDDPERTGLRVLEDANDTWMPTRSIWNQHTYHINNINDDGTIPQYEEPSWLTHNSYRLNAFAVDTRCQKPPVAYEETYTTLENTAKSIAVIAKDINNDTLSYAITQEPQYGTLVGEGPYYVYTPNSDYVGDDSFAYKVNDGKADSNEANISINILSSENAPIANDDNASLNEDSNVTVDILANDENITAVSSIAIVVSPNYGEASIVDGKVFYVPDVNFNGEDSFHYTYRDDNGFVSNSAKVTLNIGESNDAPEAFDQNLTIPEDAQVILTLEATDADEDALVYSIVTSPQHGTLNGIAPHFSYTPHKDYVGEDSFTFKANDGNVDSNIGTVTLNILAQNDAPVSIAGKGQQAIVGEEVYLSGLHSYDVDGNITSYEWKEGNITLSTEASFSKADFTLGIHTLTLTVLDNHGLSDTSTTTVNILPVNAPDIDAPVITLLGANPYRLNIGETYSEPGATAYDQRDGEVSIAINSNVNTFIAGTYEVNYTAVDSAGNIVTKVRTVMVIDSSGPDNTPPVITLLGDNPYTVYEGTTYVDPGVRVVDDHDGNIGYLLSHNVDTSALGSYQVTYSATDNAGNTANATREVLVRDPNGNRAPIADAGADVIIAFGGSVTFDASNSSDIDGTIVSYIWKASDVNLSTSVSFTKSDFSLGIHTVTLEVVDNEGAMATDEITIRVTDPSDTTPPVVSISSPVENAKVTFLTEVTGTVTDDNLASYSLLVSPVGEENYIEIGSGNLNVVEDALGSLDATTLQNGIYDLTLIATDENGAQSVASTQVRIEGRAKIGNFSFTVTDFDIQVAGLPVQVNRTYSTLQRFEKLDFTYGWSVDYQNVKIEENIDPGKEWKMTPDVFVGSCFKFDKSHQVSVSLPDGTTERFEFRFERECGHYFAGSFYDAPKLYALDGSTAKLEAIDASDSIAMYSNGDIVDPMTLDTYNPSVYRLTLANGMVYEVKEGEGLKQVKNLRGDTLTYNDDGIISSQGESLTFERDSEDRIIQITDLAGKSVTYNYDANGDLESVVDQLGQITTYSYLEGHLLEEWFDASGRRITKNIYDESGRLMQTIDPDGNVVEFTHDLDGKEEIVKDKLGRISLFVYDEEGNVLSQTNPEGETTTYIYDEDGNQLSVTDPLGNTITNEYDSRGNLLSTTDALGNTEVTTYNSYGSPTTISDKNGNTMDIVYNDYNDARSFTTATGAKNTFYYDQFGNKVESTNEYNQTTTYYYDYKSVLGSVVSSKGNLLKETRPDGTVIEHTFDESSNLLTTTTTLTDGSVTTTSNTYDAFNRLTSTTDELGQTTTHTYDTRGNKVSTTDSQGRVTSYTYNNHNKLTLTTYPDGTTESKTYDAMDNLLSGTNQDGETTSYEYDGADRLIKTTYADGTFTSTEYDAAGRTISMTDENGNTTSYEYDAVGNRISTTDALGNKTTFTYDAEGNMLSMTDALNQTTFYEYNALNQRVKTIYPDGTILEEAKNLSGLPSTKTDESGQVTSYSYDISRTIPLLNQVTLANNAVTSYGYDSEGKKTSQTDALGRTTSWNYRATGELQSETLPLGQSESYTYDAQGKQTQINDYANKAQTFIYDANDKLVRIEYADGSTVTYDYTPSGRLKTLTDAQGTITNTYDERGRLKSQTNPSGDTITYTYDGVGNITEIETPTQTITKSYDALNRLESVTDSSGVITYAYDALGRNTTIDYSNGMQTTYVYDSRHRITNITHANSSGDVLQSFAYTLNEKGFRTKIVEHTGREVAYTYNEVDQLTSETITNDPNGNNTTTTFTYDVVGNVVTKTIDGVDTDYTYNDNDQLTQKGSTTLTYDANGNLVNQDDIGYEYDDKNRLTKVTTPTDTVEYSYDANDNRVAKIINGETTTYLVDTNTPYAQVITESKEDGTQIEYTYGNDLISNGKHYFLTDALGSTRGLIDETEQLTDTYNYTPYGELSNHTGSSENDFLYTGEQFDQETDNYYLRARYYSPNNARFLTRDTYDGRDYEPATLNHYGYVHGNPINYIDPSGHMTMMSLGSSVSISSSLRTANKSKSVEILQGLLNAAVDVKGGTKGMLIDVIQDLAIQAVMGSLYDIYDKPKTKQAIGTHAHDKFEKMIKESFGKDGKISWWQHDVYIVPEVFFDSDGSPTAKRASGSLGVDVAVYVVKKGKKYTKKDLKIIFDLKTGKSWNNRHISKLRDRFGNVPIIQLMVPIIGSRK